MIENFESMKNVAPVTVRTANGDVSIRLSQSAANLLAASSLDASREVERQRLRAVAVQLSSRTNTNMVTINSKDLWWLAGQREAA